MTNRLFVLFITLLASFVFAGIPAIAKSKKRQSSEQETKITVQYSGMLNGENGMPIGGVYPIKFSLHKNAKTRRASWEETLWVSVDYGRYSVSLGETTAIPKKLNLNKMYIGVSIVGVGEVLRERLVVEADILVKPLPVEKQAPGAKNSGRVESAEYADKAELAYKALNAEKLDNMTVEELKSVLDSPVRIGKKVWTSKSVGGSGGDNEFDLRCPKGQIVVGIRGMEGKLIDSLQLVCVSIE